MKKFISSVLVGASSALIIPLSLIPEAAKLCETDSNGVLQTYSVQRPDRYGVQQTLTFDRQAQVGFCKTLSF